MRYSLHNPIVKTSPNKVFFESYFPSGGGVPTFYSKILRVQCSENIKCNLFACFHACNVRGFHTSTVRQHFHFVPSMQDIVPWWCPSRRAHNHVDQWTIFHVQLRKIIFVNCAVWCTKCKQLKNYFFPSTGVYEKWTCLHHTISICQREKPVMHLENVGNPSH